jgi:hypothetical protein
MKEKERIEEMVMKRWSRFYTTSSGDGGAGDDRLEEVIDRC